MRERRSRAKLFTKVILDFRLSKQKPMRNVERFGMMEHILAPEAVTQESLEELTGFIPGETGKVGPPILKNAWPDEYPQRIWK